MRIRAVLLVVLALVACAEPEDFAIKAEQTSVSSAQVRSARRAYDGAPPTIPHSPLRGNCTACHNTQGVRVEGLGFAPPSPHERTDGVGLGSRCVQCHVGVETTDVFTANRFSGLRQDLRHGRRLNPLSPPTIPHKTFMRDNCLACHSGPAAREEIRTDHPLRANCRQCHAAVNSQSEFGSLTSGQ